MIGRTNVSEFLVGRTVPSRRERKVLVLGGDAVGAEIARRLVQEGFEVLLTGDAGGLGADPGLACAGAAELAHVSGFVGDFQVTLEQDNGTREATVGAIVAAQPAAVSDKHEVYDLPTRPGIPSLSELESLLDRNIPLPERSGEWYHAVFLCGLEGESDPASFARVLTCIERLQTVPNVQCYVFSRHLKVAAWGLEKRYRDCREQGTLFFRFEGDIPVFEGNAPVPVLVFRDPLLGVELELVPDLLVVDEQALPPASLEPLLRIIPSAPLYRPFLQPESHRFPGVSTPKAGIFAVGPSRGVFEPERIRSDVEAVTVGLKQWEWEDKTPTSFEPPQVDPSRCILCLTCVRLCPHGAIAFHKRAEIDPKSCKNCGICAAECPNRAISLTPADGERPLIRRITDGITACADSRKVVAFLCANSAAHALACTDRAVREHVVPITVPCAGTVSLEHLMHSLRAGAQAVVVSGCFKGNCASLYGSTMAEERARQVGDMLVAAGLDERRVRFVPVAANTPTTLADAVRDLISTLPLGTAASNR